MTNTLAYYGPDLIMAVNVHGAGPRRQCYKTFFFITDAQGKQERVVYPLKVFIG